MKKEQKKGIKQVKKEKFTRKKVIHKISEKKSIKMPDTEIEFIDKSNLIMELRSSNPNKKEIIILDCRSANDYVVSHIKHAANISIPTIMLRRLKEGVFVYVFLFISCI